MKKFIFASLFFLSFAFIQTNVSAQSIDTGNEIANKFLAMLDGTEESAQSAIQKFASQEVIANGMIPFGNRPKVTKVEDNCVYFTLTDDGESNEYYICTESDKITTFDWE